MPHEQIILELLERIQSLERRVAALESQPDAPAEPPAPARARGLSPQAIDACYDLALRLEREPELDAARALEELAASHGCQATYAVCCVTAVRGMLHGRQFKYAVSRAALQRYFDRILEDYGRQGLRRALTAARAHAAYQQSHGNPARSIVRLCDAYDPRA